MTAYLWNRRDRAKIDGEQRRERPLERSAAADREGQASAVGVSRYETPLKDGFAGPGSYTNSAEGSPLAVLSALSEIKRAAGEGWCAGKVHIALVEEDKDRFAALADSVRQHAMIPDVFIYLIDSTFEAALNELRAAIPRFFHTTLPLFAFIDPFGVKGFCFGTVRQLLASGTSEVLVNFDADGVARVLRAGTAAAHEPILGEQWI